MSENWSPLEEHLKTLAETRKNSFPNPQDNYWDRYTALLGNLKMSVYPHINAGLACLSKSPGIYTDHGPAHFDEVVRYAGFLIEAENESENNLNPYELYLLLCAIRLHDSGNIDGREEHDKRVYSILKRYGGRISQDNAEAQLISSIAQAHGGYTFAGSKDTIRELQESTIVGPAPCRPRLVAALVRFADEICEHTSRAAHHHIETGTLPKENRLFQFYAKSIVGAKPDRKNSTFKLNLLIDTAYLVEKYTTPKNAEGKQEEKYLIDDILDRVDKLNHERVYCNRFLSPQLRIEAIEVEIKITKQQMMPGGFEIPQQCDLKRLTIRDDGYPTVPNNWRNAEPGLTGEQFAARAREGWNK
jgi:HD superfamily phosphodiesterase